jgi:RimJ/RimL family protein N-acetyltransferase
MKSMGEGELVAPSPGAADRALHGGEGGDGDAMTLMLELGQIPVLETARLRLRRVEERDLDVLTAMFGDPRYMRFLSDGKLADRAAAWRTIAGALGHWALRGYGFFAVDEKASGSFIGWCGLLNPEGWPGIEIAWGITPARWRQGFATEAATAVLRYAADTLRLSQLISLIHPDNAASIRVAEKIGERFVRTIEFQGNAVRLYSITLSN